MYILNVNTKSKNLMVCVRLVFLCVSGKNSVFLELIKTANVVPGDRMPKLVSKSERKGKCKN